MKDSERLKKETEIVNLRDTPQSQEDIDTNKAWIVANEYTNSIGKIASNFSSAVRAITISEHKHKGSGTVESEKMCRQYVLPWLKRSPSLKAVFYYAAESMYEEQLDECESLTLPKLLQIFHPGEVASILGLVYLSKRLRKRCDSKEWERIATMMQIQMELGALVGERVGGIGPGTGMLLGGVRALAYSVFAINHLDEFKIYRRESKKNGELFDLQYEIDTWGCNHLHIASLLVQNMGFGLNAGLGLGLGMASKLVKDPQRWFLALDEETQCWQVALSWVEALHTQSSIPDFVPEGHDLFVPLQEAHILEKQAKGILAKGSTFDWMERNRDDLTEELCIRLGLVFDAPDDEEDAIFKEIQQAEDFVDLNAS